MFSIIIPTYNQAHLIHRCIESLLNQTYQEWEAIIINNYSSDDTVKVVESYNDTRIKLYNFRNKGIIAASRNYGISKSTGNWICFLDSDDYWTPDKLYMSLPFLDRYDLIYTDMYKYKKDLKISGKLKGYQISENNGYEQMLLKGNPIINSSAIIRRTLLDNVGLISENPQLTAVEDFDFWLKIVRSGARMKHINKPLGFYYMGEGLSFTTKQVAKLKNLYEAHKSNVKDKSLRDEIFARLRYRQGRWLQSLSVKKRALPYLKYSLCSTSLFIKLKSIFFITKIKLG